MEILKRIADKLQSLNKTRDPSDFNDEIALRTQWEAFRKASGNFNTHKLAADEDSGYGLRYKPAGGFYFLTGIFMLIGGGTAAGIVGSTIQKGEPLDSETLVPALFSMVFFVIGFALYIGLRRPVFFDLTERCMVLGDSRTYFSDIHALQLVRQRGGEHTNYQINLVLRDAGRIFVMNYADRQTARKDAARIAQAIGLAPQRIWDALPGYEEAAAGQF